MNEFSILEYFEEQISDENYWVYLSRILRDWYSDYDDSQDKTEV